VLRPTITTGRYDTAAYGEADLVDAVATFDDSTGSAALFVVNRSTTETQTVRVDVRDLGVGRIREALSLWDDDVYAKNTLHDQTRVGLRPTPVATLSDGELTLQLPPVSWTGVSLA
jgi:alpha-N-arabinofuranosidase